MMRLKVEDGVVIGTWDYQADPDVKFTDAQVEQLDGPLPKRIYLYVTGGRAATSTFVALSSTTATQALKAIAERADKMSTVYVRGQRLDLAEIERQERRAEGDEEEEPPHFTVRILTDDLEAVSEYVARRGRVLAPFATAWPRCGLDEGRSNLASPIYLEETAVP